MRTETLILASAMDVLARDIQSGDGVANAAIAEAAQRLRELEWEIARLESASRIDYNRADTARLDFLIGAAKTVEGQKMIAFCFPVGHDAKEALDMAMLNH